MLLHDRPPAFDGEAHTSICSTHIDLPVDSPHSRYKRIYEYRRQTLNIFSIICHGYGDAEALAFVLMNVLDLDVACLHGSAPDT